MTLSAVSNLAIGFGNGVITAFPFNYPLNTTDGSDVLVYIVDNLGNVTNIATNYNVNVAGSAVNYPNTPGVAPLLPGVTALPSGWSIVMLRVEPLNQNLVLTNGGVFDAPSIMSAFDKLTMICQQLQEQINRCYKTQPGTVPSSTVQPNVVPQNPFLTGNYASLKSQAVAFPSVPFIGFATDLGEPGAYTIVFYSGILTIGDAGFITV